MKRAALIAVLLAVCSAPLTARAQPTNGLSLDEVLASVDAHFPLVLAARTQVTQAEGERLAAEGAFDTTVRARVTGVPAGYYDYASLDVTVEQPTELWGTTFFAGYRYGTGDIPIYYGYLQTLDAGEVRVGATVPLWRDGPIDRRRASQARARIGVDIAGASLDVRRNEVRRAAALRYWDWVAAALRLEVARGLLAMAVERDAGLATRVERGDLPEIERIENTRAILQRQERLIAAERQLEQTSIELSIYLRDPDGHPRMPGAALAPTGVVELPADTSDSLSDHVQTALRSRPELRRFARLQDSTRVELEWAENQFAPRIDATVTFSLDLGATQCSIALCNPMLPSSPTGGVFARPGTDLALGLMVEIPIPFRGARGRIDATRAQLEGVAFELELAEDRATAEVQDSVSALHAARERVRVAREQIDVAARLEGLERRRFELGDSTLLIVNLREQATADARIVEAEAVQAFFRAQADLQYATARGLAAQ